MDPRPGHRENDQTTPACRTECTESRRLERKMLWESGSKRKKRFRYATIKLMKRNENVDVAIVCSADFGLIFDKTCFESGRFCCKKKEKRFPKTKINTNNRKTVFQSRMSFLPQAWTGTSPCRRAATGSTKAGGIEEKRTFQKFNDFDVLYVFCYVSLCSCLRLGVFDCSFNVFSKQFHAKSTSTRLSGFFDFKSTRLSGFFPALSSEPISAPAPRHSDLVNTHDSVPMSIRF